MPKAVGSILSIKKRKNFHLLLLIYGRFQTYTRIERLSY
jgi:hypothetical protein